MKNPTILFFLIVIALMALITILTVKLLAQLCPEKQQKKATLTVVALNVLAILGIAGSKSLFGDFAFAGELLQLLVIWFIFQLFAVALSAVWRGLCFVWRKLALEDVPLDESKRQFCRQAAYLPVAAACGISLYGSLDESQRIETVLQDIRLPRLPSGMKGFTMAQLSDVHLGYFFSLEKLEATLGQIAANKPDVLLITGDLFDDRQHNAAAVKMVDSYVKAFPKGIYFCWGNHEYMRGAEEIAAALAQTSIKVLRDEAALLLTGVRPLYLLGTDYPLDRSKNQAEQCSESLAHALEDVPDNAVKILMAHHSIFIDPAFASGVDLTLTGHTHGGQLGLFGVPLVPLFKYTRGMYRQGNLYGYVNSGAGSWCPFRFGCPAEITYFSLQAQT